MTEPLALTVAAAAKALSLSERTVRALCKSGDLECRYVESKVLIPVAGIKAFLSALPTENPKAS